MVSKEGKLKAQLREHPKEQWVPHEVRRERAENIVAYAILAISLLGLIALLVLVLNGYE